MNSNAERKRKITNRNREQRRNTRVLFYTEYTSRWGVSVVVGESVMVDEAG